MDGACKHADAGPAAPANRSTQPLGGRSRCTSRRDRFLQAILAADGCPLCSILAAPGGRGRRARLGVVIAAVIATSAACVAGLGPTAPRALARSDATHFYLTNHKSGGISQFAVGGDHHGRAAGTGVMSTPFATTDTGIHLGLAFDYQTHDATDVERSTDYIWGGYFLNWNFGFYPHVPAIDGYMPFDEDPWSQRTPGHSLSDWRARHPDWIVYQCDGKTPAYYGSGDTNVPLDFSNPAVRSWQVQQAAKLFQMGATGVGFDNFTFANYSNGCGVYRHGVWMPLGYPGPWADNAKLDSNMMAWIEDIRSRLQQQFAGKTLTVNFNTQLSGLEKLKAITPYIDMDTDESAFTDWQGRRLTGAAWWEEVDALEYLNSHGKAFFLDGIVPAAADQDVTDDELNWSLANYLLVKGSHSYVYVYAGHSQGASGSPSGYGSFYDRREYHVAIGYPTSGLYQSQGLQMRNYSGGMVIVNPSSGRRTAYLPHSYSDMWGQRYSLVNLPSGSAIVLLG
jgi:Hypothetical glycosyl hydrolase family 15